MVLPFSARVQLITLYAWEDRMTQPYESRLIGSSVGVQRRMAFSPRHLVRHCRDDFKIEFIISASFIQYSEASVSRRSKSHSTPRAGASDRCFRGKQQTRGLPCMCSIDGRASWLTTVTIGSKTYSTSLRLAVKAQQPCEYRRTSADSRYRT